MVRDTKGTVVAVWYLMVGVPKTHVLAGGAPDHVEMGMCSFSLRCRGHRYLRSVSSADVPVYHAGAAMSSVRRTARHEKREA